MSGTHHSNQPKSTDVPAPQTTEAQLQRRPFPEVESKDDKATAAPTPISADWRSQQEKVARARFDPGMISLYPADPFKEEKKEKPVQKKSEAAFEPEKEEEKLIQKKSGAAPESEKKEKPIQKKAEESSDTEEQEKPIRKKAEKTELEEKDNPIQQKSEEPVEDSKEPLQRESEAIEEEKDKPSTNKQVQTKLSVGKPGDRYEQEADQVAAKVMTMPDPAQNRIQRQTEDADIQPKSLANTITPLVQRQTDEDVQSKSGRDRSAHNQSVNADFENRLASSKASGSPLPREVRSFMEPRFGVDLSHVRVHTGTDSAQMNKDVRAQAFAYRNHIFYAAGKAPAKDDLTAHELTHVIQQTGGRGLNKTIRRQPEDNSSVQAKKSLDHNSVDATNNKLTPAETSIQRHEISMISPQIQGNWFTDGARIVGDVVTGDLEGAKRRLLDSVGDFASGMPGYSLLSVVLGKDPIKDKPVARNATNLVKGILELVPGGDRLFQNLQESGALQKAFDWFEKELKRLNLTWDAIKTLFRRAVNAVSPDDIFNPGGLIGELVNIFREPIQRITNFALAVGQKVMEFVFEGAMALAGKGGADRVMGILRKVGGLFMKIVKDPVGFIGNLVRSVKGGFERFSTNIMTHMKAGLMGWLFGTLSGAGLQMPPALNMKGMLSVALQVVGATYQKLRKNLVKRMGEKKVSQVEKAFGLLRTIASGGLIAAWQQISQSVGDVKEMVISQVRNWVITTIIKQAVIKLVSMFNPAGAVVQAVIAVYNTVMFFIERMQQIMELASAVFNSINSIAAGNIGTAIKFVEQSMAKSLPVIISFMARLMGLGGISSKIRNIIKKMQKPIDRAIDRIIGIVMKFAKKLFRTKNKKNRGKEILEPDNMRKLKEDVVADCKRQYKTVQEFNNALKLIHRRYQSKGLKYLAVENVQADPKQPFTIFAKINPTKPLTIVHWNALFERGHEPEDKSSKFEMAGQTTHAMLIVNGRMELTRQSGNGKHAEELLIQSPEWMGVLDKAFSDSTSKDKPKTTVIKVLINRSTCHNRCSSLLPIATNEYWRRFTGGLSSKKNNTQFFLVMRGVYEGKEGPTTANDLKGLAASGWNLQVLWPKGRQPTTHGKLLMEFIQQLKRVKTTN